MAPRLGRPGAGNIYVVTGNGTWDYASGAPDLGESYIKLAGAGGLWVSTLSLFGNPAYFNQTVYFCGSGDPLVAFPIANAQLAAAPKSSSASRFGYPGCVPTTSANHTTNRSARALESSATLHAYDATDLAHELYNSNQDASRDSLGSHVRFSVPTATGVPGGNDPPSTAITPVTADIGGQPDTIEYSGVRTGFAGAR